jgi:hypothetical protein
MGLAAAGILCAALVLVSNSEGSEMKFVAKGTFTVQMKPDGEPVTADKVSLGRMSLSKTFAGDLAGTSEGRMLTSMTGVEGSAGYVAIERVTGTLHGKKGSFVLQHSGTMNRGEQSLSITIVPDSGTGELAGISGTFRLRIANKTHFYELEYQL